MRWLTILLIVALTSGCGAPVPANKTPIPETGKPSIVETPISTDEPDLPDSEMVTLKIWVPPEFDPTNDSPEGDLLKARLEEFINRKANVRIEIRVKAVEGPGGILDMLTTASTAAPLALPDLVALPQHALENAAIKGLLHPFDGLTNTMDEFASKLSNIQNSIFGIPFAGDALIMVYRPSVLGEQPDDWASMLETSTQSSASLSFPASNMDSLFTLTLYQSLGGALVDDENRPILDAFQLTEVLTYYHQAELSMLMPFWLTQYETDEQSWAAYEENQTEMVITWANRYMRTLPADSSGAPIPTQDGILFTLATGWTWALASPDPDRQDLSAQLAEFLTNADYLAAWTSAAGYIPPRSNALSLWENISLQTLLKQVASSAELVPSLHVLTALGPVLQRATVDVLKEEASPITAAEAAIETLATP